MAAAKEFNIGKDTLVDFLVGKGFSKDDLKPTSKLTEDMYRFLQQEFQGDKVAKIKSDQIDLPKGSLEAKKKKEDEPPRGGRARCVATRVEKKRRKRKRKRRGSATGAAQQEEPSVETKEEDEAPPVIENIKAEKLEGPKILGKIELPVNNDTRPKQPSEEKGSASASPSRKKITAQAMEDLPMAITRVAVSSMVAVSKAASMAAVNMDTRRRSAWRPR
jgi:translation initiation factor IF-2